MACFISVAACRGNVTEDCKAGLAAFSVADLVGCPRVVRVGSQGFTSVV